MIYVNSENAAWHALHNGARVPINDTGVEGAPAALASYEPEWEEGSVNKAVYDTHILNGGTFTSEDYQNAVDGKLSLKDVGKYINPDMLYGFGADSRNTVPGDMMSYRAYPTGVIERYISAVEVPESTVPWNYGGTVITGSSGRYTIFSTYVELAYKLPYDFQYTAQITNGIVTDSINVMIASGSLLPTHYKSTTDTTWIVISTGKVFFSVDTSALTGSQNFVIQTGTVLQAPFYGTLDNLTETLLESEYGSGLVTIENIGNTYTQSNIISYSCLVSQCNEVEQSTLFGANLGAQTPLFKDISDPLAIGTLIWLDSAATVQAPAGYYAWANFARTLPAQTDNLLIDDSIIVDMVGSYTQIKKLVIKPEPGYENVWYIIQLSKDGVVVQDNVYKSGEDYVITNSGIGTYSISIKTSAVFKFSMDEFNLLTNTVINESMPMTYTALPSDVNVYKVTDWIFVNNAGEIAGIETNIVGVDQCWLLNRC